MHIKYQGEISIEQVLADMRATPGKVFWLAFVRSSGKNRGTVKVVSRCGYGAPFSVGSSTVGSGQSGTEKTLNRLLNPIGIGYGTTGKSYLHVDKGTLPMTDHDTGQYLTPLISHLIGYNLKKIIHG